MLIAATLLFVTQLPPLIAIDPGHPSEVGSGTHGKKITELKVAWQIGVALNERLKSLGYRTVMTKSTENEKVTNRRRAEIGNEAKASLMVRLHCDAGSGSGFAVFYPTQQGTSHGVKGPSVEVLKGSKREANLFYLGLSQSLKGQLNNQGLKSDLATAIGGQQGALTGSVFSKVPVVLVEMVVLTNPKDEGFILSKTGQNAMVKGLADGVRAAVPLVH
ncbi:hypothetical protein BH11ARM1_BH11ARM1_02370 [soil metagenome]